MSAPKRVLFILTSYGHFQTVDKLTGWYLPELVHPYYELVNQGYEAVIASPKGGKAPLDPSSIEAFKADEQCRTFLAEKLSLTENTERLSPCIGKADRFAAIYYVGGHGPMFDPAHDEASQTLIREFADQGKVISAVCHGPAPLGYAKLSNGSCLITDCKVAGFSSSGEEAFGFGQHMPFSLEDALNENSAGKFETASQHWGECVKVARNGNITIITGQNPASAAGVAKAILKTLHA